MEHALIIAPVLLGGDMHKSQKEREVVKNDGRQNLLLWERGHSEAFLQLLAKGRVHSLVL